MPFLLVDIDGCEIAREHERLVVRRGARVLSAHRVREIDSVIAWGRVEITRPAMEMMLSRRIPLHLVSGTGRYRGCMVPPEMTRPARRIAQHRVLGEEEGQIRFARIGTSAQIRNVRAVVRRWSIHRDESRLIEAMELLKGLSATIEDATTLAELRGAEGIAWRAAFDALAAVLPAGLGFQTRLRRPAPDPVNALLGLFGVMAVGQADAVLRTAGLDPALGYSHGHSRGGPALAMDLADIYRPMLCLAPVVTLFTKRILTQHDFEGLGYSATLTREGARKAIAAYVDVARRPVTRRGTAAARTYLQHMRYDAGALARALTDADRTWEPLTIR